MAALKDLMKVMEHQTAVEKRAADGILSCLEQGGKGEKPAEQWLKSGGDPQGEYMVHLAEYAEKNVMEK